LVDVCYVFPLRFALVRNVRHKGDLAGTLDGNGQLALMLCAYAAHPAGHYLAALGGELTKAVHVLVIYMFHLVGAEGTNLTAALAGTGLHGPTLFHDEVSPFKSLTAAAA